MSVQFNRSSLALLCGTRTGTGYCCFVSFIPVQVGVPGGVAGGDCIVVTSQPYGSGF